MEPRIISMCLSINWLRASPSAKVYVWRTGEEAQKKQPGWAACFLPAVFVGDGEFFAGVAATGAKDATAVGAGHSCAEAVFVHTLAAGRLECSFHDISILYFSRKDCKGSNSRLKCQIFLRFLERDSLASLGMTGSTVQYVPPACRRTRRPGARRRRARCARSRAGACDGPSRWQFPR